MSVFASEARASTDFVESESDFDLMIRPILSRCQEQHCRNVTSQRANGALSNLEYNSIGWVCGV
jgi:hypothetical protein